MYFYNESLIFSLHSLHKYNKLYLRTNKKVSIMQAMFKSELAKLAGVSSRTFRRYLATRRAILTVNYPLKPSTTSPRTTASTFHRALS